MIELPIPEGARRASRASELLRVYHADGRLNVMLRIGAWGDAPHEEAKWAQLFADCIRRIAGDLASRDGISAAQALRRIRDALDEELDRPTSTHRKYLRD